MEQLTFLEDDLHDRYRITWDDQSFEFDVTNGRVSAAPPLATWAMGTPIARVLAWYHQRGAEVTKVEYTGGERKEGPPDARQTRLE